MEGVEVDKLSFEDAGLGKFRPGDDMSNFPSFPQITYLRTLGFWYHKDIYATFPYIGPDSCARSAHKYSSCYAVCLPSHTHIICVTKTLFSRLMDAPLLLFKNYTSSDT